MGIYYIYAIKYDMQVRRYMCRQEEFSNFIKDTVLKIKYFHGNCHLVSEVKTDGIYYYVVYSDKGKIYKDLIGEESIA